MAIDDEHGRRHAVRIARVLEGFITASALATIDICADDERTLLDQIGRGDHHNEPESLDLVATLDAMAADDPQATAIIDDDQTTTRAGPHRSVTSVRCGLRRGRCLRNPARRDRPTREGLTRSPP